MQAICSCISNVIYGKNITLASLKSSPLGAAKYLLVCQQRFSSWILPTHLNHPPSEYLQSQLPYMQHQAMFVKGRFRLENVETFLLPFFDVLNSAYPFASPITQSEASNSNLLPFLCRTLLLYMLAFNFFI